MLLRLLVSIFAPAVPRRSGRAPGLFAVMGATVGFTLGVQVSELSPLQTFGSAQIAGGGALEEGGEGISPSLLQLRAMEWALWSAKITF